MQRRIAIGLIALALLVGCGRAAQTAQAPAQSAPQASGPPIEAIAIERVEGDLRPFLPGPGPTLDARIARIRAELAALSPTAKPRDWGLKQIELAYALRAKGHYGGDAERAAGVAAAEAALTVFTRARDPIQWATAQGLRAALLDPWVSPAPVEPARIAAADAAAQSALGVFNRAAYPLQYLEISCQRRYAHLVRGYMNPTGRNGPTMSAVMSALQSACGALVVGDGFSSTSARPISTKSALLRTGGSRARSQQFTDVMRGAVAAQTPAQIAECRRNMTMVPKETRDLMQQNGVDPCDMRTQLARFTTQQNSGELPIDIVSGLRAMQLSGALALDELGLGLDQRRSAFAARARADAAAAVSGYSGAAWRSNKTMWAAQAEFFAIVAPLPDSAPRLVEVEVAAIAPVIVDGARGFIAYKTAAGQGGLARTAGDWARTLGDEMNAAFTGEFTEERMAAIEKGDISFVTDALNVNVEGDGPRHWLAAYQAGDFARAIADFRAEYEAAWSPALRDAITRAGARPGDRVLILPDGAASMLPLGLLRDRTTGRTLSEDYELVLAPSFLAYEASLRRAAESRPPALAISAPSEAVTGLAFTASETAMIGSHFGAAIRPIGATRASAFHAMPQANYWHFATHGEFDQNNPRRSWLMLGENNYLTLGDLYQSQQPLGHPRLVVLSACETGLFDAARDPDDYVGLPTGLLQAGAAGVIASLWQVSDVSTTLLMAKLYDLHFGGLSPPAALRQAQLWLKGADAATLTDYVESERVSHALTQAEADRLRAEIARETAARPYADPVYWGAFVYYGA